MGVIMNQNPKEMKFHNDHIESHNRSIVSFLFFVLLHQSIGWDPITWAVSLNEKVIEPKSEIKPRNAA